MAVEIIDDTGIADLTGEGPFGNSKDNMANFKSMTPSAPSIVGLFWNRLHIAAEPWGLPQFARGMNRVAKRNAPSHVAYLPRYSMSVSVSSRLISDRLILSFIP